MVNRFSQRTAALLVREAELASEGDRLFSRFLLSIATLSELLNTVIP